MFCTNCGGEVKEGVKFCSGCGKDLSGVSNGQAAPAVQSEANAVYLQPVITHTQTPTADEKYCFSCGAIMKKAADLCVKCGVNQNTRSSSSAVNVYCAICGNSIKKDASMCPFCGVQQGTDFQSFKKDKKGFAITSLVLGLVGLFAWLLPFTGFPVTVVGLIMGVVGFKSSKKGMAIAGLITSMVGFIATVINSAIGAYQGSMYY